MTRTELLRRLQALADDDYRRFSSRLLPGVDNLLGVRLPRLREMARALAREAGATALSGLLSDETFEEVMLQGMVIGYLDLPIAERLSRIAAFVPKIDNWSVCDSFCAGLRFQKADEAQVFAFLAPYLRHERTFFVRFGAVMLLDHFIDDAHIDETIARLCAVRHEAYYAKMAVAWALSVCFIRYPARTMPVFLDDRLDGETRGKAIQKIIESRRVDLPSKQALRALKYRAPRHPTS